MVTVTLHQTSLFSIEQNKNRKQNWQSINHLELIFLISQKRISWNFANEHTNHLSVYRPVLLTAYSIRRYQGKHNKLFSYCLQHDILQGHACFVHVLYVLTTLLCGMSGLQHFSWHHLIWYGNGRHWKETLNEISSRNRRRNRGLHVRHVILILKKDLKRN